MKLYITGLTSIRNHDLVNKVIRIIPDRITSVIVNQNQIGMAAVLWASRTGVPWRSIYPDKRDYMSIQCCDREILTKEDVDFVAIIVANHSPRTLALARMAHDLQIPVQTYFVKELI